MAVARIGVSLEGPLLEDFDRMAAEDGFSSRSEALRNLIREAIARRSTSRGAKAVGTITFLYHHNVGMVAHRILHRQHDFLGAIRASAHTHLGEETCLEVVIVEDKASRIHALANRIKTLKGVLFAEAVLTSPDLH